MSAKMKKAVLVLLVSVVGFYMGSCEVRTTSTPQPIPTTNNTTDATDVPMQEQRRLYHPCEDADPNCDYYDSSFGCDGVWMTHNCRRSCNLCGPTTHLSCTVGTNEVTYTHYPEHCVGGFNGVNHGNRTLCECQELCEADSSCQGFEYGVNHGGANTNYPVGVCQMSTKRYTASNPDSCNASHHNLDFYEPMPSVELTWYTKPRDTSTYALDASFCANKGAGGRLATYAEYCPGGAGVDVYGREWTGEQWAAFSGAGLNNEWVFVGDLTVYGDQKLVHCKKHKNHTHLSGGKPSWGTDPNKLSWETYVLCALPAPARRLVSVIV